MSESHDDSLTLFQKQGISLSVNVTSHQLGVIREPLIGSSSKYVEQHYQNKRCTPIFANRRECILRTIAQKMRCDFFWDNPSFSFYYFCFLLIDCISFIHKYEALFPSVIIRFSKTFPSCSSSNVYDLFFSSRISFFLYSLMK